MSYKLTVAALISTAAIVSLCNPVEAKPSVGEAVSTLMLLCLGKTTNEKLEASGKGDLSLTLKRLLDTGASASATTSYTKEELMGIQGGISAEMSNLQADQADKIRNCTEPFRNKIMEIQLKGLE